MKGHLIYLRVFQGITLSCCFSLSVVHADDISDLISKSEASNTSAANEASTLIGILRNNVSQGFAPAGNLVGPLDKGPGNGGVSSNQGAASSIAKTLPSNSLRRYPKQKALKDITLPHEGKGKCKDNVSEGSGKCPSSLLQGLEAKQVVSPSSNTQLLIFVSESIPANSMKELWTQAQRVGGKLLLRGLVGGSFKESQSYIQELSIVADIDPTKFDEFEVTCVPTFILSKGDKHDKVVGNIPLSGFLEQSSISGDLRKEAGQFYKMLEGGNS